ncbi:long-chain-fatty-acid--CoA ligase, putative [Entamoeba invadens IP1]|uniref:Long-chain-fatty-acid--CoA ligase, putative n=1 Tax=Entamoeba invadens IP1 TaxID=370355 RepID=A0A0A1UAC7_ENTIV|nr:long-chain-fatty-acid--CoA ligase, putative [Entamoeba invadens IP1]ELP90131.1 long-chain-fatty-acid--CoA ligase, putative [Entamoeba invadens IP1]|eukprot:XP_004256902.1 long-chain-fatty-acid--CoA ligase, putative [Entamoeba invadens IP1]
MNELHSIQVEENTTAQQDIPHTLIRPDFDDIKGPFPYIHKDDKHVYMDCQLQYWNMNSFFSKEEMTKMTLFEMFKRRCDLWPEEFCLSYRKKDEKHVPKGDFINLKAKECLTIVEEIASGIVRKLNIKKGATAAVFSTNRYEWILTEFAFHRQGIILVPLYSTLTTEQLCHVIDTAECSYVFCSDEVLDRVQDLKSHRTFTSVCFDDVKNESVDFTLNELREEGRRQIEPPNLPNKTDTCSIFFTSGTSGVPKGAIHTHWTITNAMCCFCFSAPFHAQFMTRGQITLSFLPLSHVYEHQIDLTFLCTGGWVYMNSGNVRYFPEEVKMASPTFLIVVPRVLQKLYDVFNSEIKKKSYVVQTMYNTAYYFKNWAVDTNTTNMVDWDYWVFGTIKALLGGRIQLVCNGSAPLSREVYDWMRVCFDVIICNGYGSTETFGGCIGTIPGLLNPKIMSTGRPCPGATFRLSNAEELGYFVSDNPPTGEIEIKGEFIFKGYFHDDVSTKEAFTEDGWFKTGDIGRINGDGTMSIIDRRKNMFKLSQGEYVATEPLERMYASHPFIEQMFVYGESTDSFLVGILVAKKKELEAFLEGKINGISDGMDVQLLKDIANTKGKSLILKNVEEYVRSQGAKGYEVGEKYLY